MSYGASYPAEHIRAFFATIAHRYDLTNHLLSFGCDYLWRRRAARMVANNQPARILDLATGSGDLARALQSACPRSSVIGADFCLPMLLRAEEKHATTNLLAADGLNLPFADATFDAVTVAFGLRNMTNWAKALAEMHRVLRPGGLILILEFSVPTPPLSWLYCPYLHFFLPSVAAFLTGSKTAYQYLSDSIERFPRGSQMCDLLLAQHFNNPKCLSINAGIVSLYTAARAPTRS